MMMAMISIAPIVYDFLFFSRCWYVSDGWFG